MTESRYSVAVTLSRISDELIWFMNDKLFAVLNSKERTIQLHMYTSRLSPSSPFYLSVLKHFWCFLTVRPDFDVCRCTSKAWPGLLLLLQVQCFEFLFYIFITTAAFLRVNKWNVDSDCQWGSAVCAYNLSEINKVFDDGDFLEQPTYGAAWRRTPPDRIPNPRPGQVGISHSHCS